MLFVIAVYIGFICSSYLPMIDFKSSVMTSINNLTKLEDLKIYPKNVSDKETQSKYEGRKSQYEGIESQYEDIKSQQEVIKSQSEVIKSQHEVIKSQPEVKNSQHEGIEFQYSQEQSYQQVRVLCWIMTGPNNYYTKVTIFM